MSTRKPTGNILTTIAGAHPFFSRDSLKRNSVVVQSTKQTPKSNRRNYYTLERTCPKVFHVIKSRKLESLIVFTNASQI